MNRRAIDNGSDVETMTFLALFSEGGADGVLAPATEVDAFYRLVINKTGDVHGMSSSFPFYVRSGGCASEPS